MVSCKDCNRRYIGCHSRCSDYKEYRKIINARVDKGDREYFGYLRKVMYEQAKSRDWSRNV